jgi:hypothetical protein
MRYDLVICNELQDDSVFDYYTNECKAKQVIPVTFGTLFDFGKRLIQVCKQEHVHHLSKHRTFDSINVIDPYCFNLTDILKIKSNTLYVRGELFTRE